MNYSITLLSFWLAAVFGRPDSTWRCKMMSPRGTTCLRSERASSESKDMDSYSTLCSRMPWHPAGSYGGALLPVSFCLCIAWKKSRGPVSLSAAVKIAAISFSSFFSFENWSFLSNPVHCQQPDFWRAVLNWKKSTNKKKMREYRDERAE